jgi:hypothetical protein
MLEHNFEWAVSRPYISLETILAMRNDLRTRIPLPTK